MARKRRTLSAAEVMGCDYTDLDQVKALADKMGPGMSVIKRPDRPNYNIVHTERKDLLVGAEVLYQT